MSRIDAPQSPTNADGVPTTSRRRPWLLPAAAIGAAVLGVVLWLTQPWLLFVDVVADESLPITVDAAGAGTDPVAADPGASGPAATASQGTDAIGTDDASAGAATDGVGAADVDGAAGASGEVEDGTGAEPADPAADQQGQDDGAETTPPATDPTGPTVPTGPVVLASGSFISRDHGTTGAAAIVRLEDGSRVLTIEDLDTDNGPDLFVYLDDTAADGPEAGFDDGISLGRLRANQGDLVYEIPDDVDLGSVVSVGIWCDRFSSLFGAADLTPVG